MTFQPSRKNTSENNKSKEKNIFFSLVKLFFIDLNNMKYIYYFKYDVINLKGG